jgi:hypothetical protein
MAGRRLLRFAAKKVAFQEKAKHKAAETAAVRIAGVCLVPLPFCRESPP